MSQELVKTDVNLGLQRSADVDFASKFVRLKPYTLTINQPMTQAEGAEKGKLRIVETGEQFSTLQVALLLEPKERRDYQEGKFPNIVRLCYSLDMIRPSEKATCPQALTCGGCKHADWTEWRNAKEKTGQSNPTLIPNCQPQYYVTFVDKETKLPIQMYVKGSSSRKSFDAGMDNVARELFKLRAKGLNPQYYDVQFTLSAQKEKSGANYFLKISNVKPITEEDRQAFGEIFTAYTKRYNSPADVEAEAAAEAEQKASNVIDAELVGKDNEAIDGEYIPI